MIKGTFDLHIRGKVCWHIISEISIKVFSSRWGSSIILLQCSFILAEFSWRWWSDRWHVDLLELSHVWFLRMAIWSYCNTRQFLPVCSCICIDKCVYILTNVLEGVIVCSIMNNWCCASALLPNGSHCSARYLGAHMVDKPRSIWFGESDGCWDQTASGQ